MGWRQITEAEGFRRYLGASLPGKRLIQTLAWLPWHRVQDDEDRGGRAGSNGTLLGPLSTWPLEGPGVRALVPWALEICPLCLPSEVAHYSLVQKVQNLYSWSGETRLAST